MFYPRLGNSGLKISQLILGTATFGELIDAEGVQRIVATALDEGISTFDTGDIYASGESEKLLGRALKGERHRVTICTKVGLRVGDSKADHARAFSTGYDHAKRWRKHGIGPNEAGLSRARDPCVHINIASASAVQRPSLKNACPRRSDECPNRKSPTPTSISPG